jgi:POT family proton-dependent oligopeptide transporter
MTTGVQKSNEAEKPGFRNTSGENARWDRSFFGHRRGLSTLFFTEMWERFSYYGMRALLILFMTAAASKGGLGFPAAKAGAIYGLYTSMVYLVSVPGGWIADRILGHRRSVFAGGVIIALGHFSMAVPRRDTFYFGLVLIVAGTGLLKPNISMMVGELYQGQDARRDAGFSIFYICINLGALIAPLVCGYLGENLSWHYGFGAAGVGMTLGLIQYKLGGKYLGSAGLVAHGSQRERRLASFAGLAIAALVIAAFAGWLDLSAQALSNALGVLLTCVIGVVFGRLLTAKDFSTAEGRHLRAIFVLFLASCVFWSSLEQAGSTLNLFAERNTNLHAWDFSLWGNFRASYLQSMNSIFVVAFAGVFAWMWVTLGRSEPSITVKFILGLVFVGLGFAILIPVANGTTASPWWLTFTYLLQTIGELCLSPVGLSAVTKLAPVRVAGLMMGLWFLSMSVGDYLGGKVASLYETFPLPRLFLIVAAFCIFGGVLMTLAIHPMKKLMGNIR